MDSFADPWDPGRVCTVLPAVVDHWRLLRAAAVDFQCLPIVPDAVCCISLGDLDRSADNLFPVQQAMCFTVMVEGIPFPQAPTGLPAVQN